LTPIQSRYESLEKRKKGIESNKRNVETKASTKNLLARRKKVRERRRKIKLDFEGMKWLDITMYWYVIGKLKAKFPHFISSSSLPPLRSVR
jgi:hypothetical protein